MKIIILLFLFYGIADAQLFPYFIDDEVALPDTTYDSNVIVNPDFETIAGTPDDGTNDNFGTWSEAATGGIIEAVTDAQSGTYAAKITNTSSGNVVMYQNMTVEAEETYKLTIWSKGDGTREGRYRVADITNGGDIKAITATGNATTTYVELTYEFVTPANCVTVRVSCYAPALAGNCFFDNLSLAKRIIE